MGSAPPRAFVEGCCARDGRSGGEGPRWHDVRPQGIEARHGHRSSPATDRRSLSQAVAHSSNRPRCPASMLIGALAGYPLIKHCMNQGYDVVELINGNTVAQTRRRADPGKPSFKEHAVRQAQRGRMARRRCAPPCRNPERASRRCRCASSCSIPKCAPIRIGETVFERNDPGSSLFGIASGSVLVEPARMARPHRADRHGLDLRRGRADLRPPARRHDPRRRRCDPGRGIADRRAEADGAVPAAKRAVNAHLDRAAAAPDVRVGADAGRSASS